MEKLVDDVKKVKKSRASAKISKRLNDFRKINNESSKRWFAELCFCLLTANSKAKTALAIEKELGVKGFCECTEKNLRDCIKKNKHRFHNNKAKYIAEARSHQNLKKTVNSIITNEGEKSAREWLAKSIRGLGFKEASHFMRNVGFKDVAIVDRHIVNLLLDYGILEEKPKTISKRIYLSIEDKLARIADCLEMSQAELDLYLWYMKTGEILK